MIKGCRKDMIHIRSLGSPYFEEAYFVVRAGKEDFSGEDDILREASRIADITGDSYKRGRMKKGEKGRSFFLYGMSLCSLIFGVVALVWG